LSKEAAKEADSFGLALSQADATQLEETSLAVSRVKTAFAGLFRQIAVALGPAIESSAQGLVSFLKSAIDWAKNIIATVRFVTEHFGEFWELAIAQAARRIVAWANDTVFFFTDTIPIAIGFFADNWVDIFTDIANFTNQLFSDLQRNIINVLKNIPGLVAGTVDWGDVWKPMLTEFVRTTQEFPEIQARALTAVERDLDRQIDSMTESLGRGLAEATAARATEVDKFSKSIGDLGQTIEDSLAIGEVAIKDLEIPEPKEEQRKPGRPDELAALERGSAEAFSRIEAARRGIGKDPVEQNTKKTADATTATERNTRELVRVQKDSTVQVAAF